MKSESIKRNWSKFWSDSSKISCADGVKSDSTEIDLFWNSFGKNLQGNTVILDLCTGGGAVIDYLSKRQMAAEETCSQFIGVDLSKVVGSNLQASRAYLDGNITLYDSTSIEELPVKENSVDFIVSQFGFEYCVTDQAVEEIFRVLKPMGQIFLVMHSANSILYKNALFEIEHIDLLVKSGVLINNLRGLLPYFAKLKNPANLQKVKSDENAIKLKKNYNRDTKILLEQISASKCPNVLEDALNRSQEIMRMAQAETLTAAKAALDLYLNELRDHRERAVDLVDCALTYEDTFQLKERFLKHGKEAPQFEELKSAGYIVGWGAVFK